MRILVCGSRHFDDWDLFKGTMTELGVGCTCIISGGAKGADTMAEAWSDYRKIDREIYYADWNKHGKAAGPIRNKQMLDEGKPDLVIAFLAPDSKGTKNMIDQATKAGIPIKVINVN